VVDLTTNGNDKTETDEQNIRYNIKKLNKENFIKNLKLPEINDNCDLNNTTTKLEEAITEAITKSAPKLNRNKRKRKVFWTKNLEKLKRILKASRKSYKAAGSQELREARLNKYRLAKQNFEKRAIQNQKKNLGKVR